MSANGEQPTPDPVAVPPPPPPPLTGMPTYGYYPPAYPPAYPQPGYYAPPNPWGYPRDHPHAGLALGLGLGGIIGGFVSGGLGFALGPFAWFFGQRARTQIKQSNGAYHSEGNATAGMVLGIIATVFLLLAIALWTLLIVSIANDPNNYNGTNAGAVLHGVIGRS